MQRDITSNETLFTPLLMTLITREHRTKV